MKLPPVAARPSPLSETNSASADRTSAGEGRLQLDIACSLVRGIAKIVTNPGGAREVRQGLAVPAAARGCSAEPGYGFRELRTRAHVQLPVDVAQVVLDRLRTEEH